MPPPRPPRFARRPLPEGVRRGEAIVGRGDNAPPSPDALCASASPRRGEAIVGRGDNAAPLAQTLYTGPLAQTLYTGPLAPALAGERDRVRG